MVNRALALDLRCDLLCVEVAVAKQQCTKKATNRRNNRNAIRAKRHTPMQLVAGTQDVQGAGTPQIQQQKVNATKDSEEASKT